MRRTVAVGCWLLLLVPPTRAADDPLQPVLAAIGEALGATTKLALIHAEATGTSESLSGLEEALLTGLSARAGLTVLPPDAVLAKAGPEFAISPDGIAGVAKRMEAEAALFVRVFQAPDRIDLQVWLVAADGKALLDQSFPLPSLPTGKVPTGKVPTGKVPEVSMTPVAGEVPQPEIQAVEPTEPVEQSKPPQPDFLSLGRRSRVYGGGSVAILGDHVAVGIGNPAFIAEDWIVLEGDHPISEPRLASLAQQNNILQRIQGDIGSMKTVRNVGIGMTLGGFIAAGIAFPFVKADEKAAITAAGAIAGTGVAVGVAGLIMWLLYGPSAAMAETPYPTHHLITREEAQQMIDSYNRALEQRLAPPPPPPAERKSPTAMHLSLLPDPRGGAAAVFLFRF